MSFQISALILKNKSALSKAYVSKKLVNCIFIVCLHIQQKYKRFNTLLMIAYRYDKVLDQEFTVLAEREKFY